VRSGDAMVIKGTMLETFVVGIQDFYPGFGIFVSCGRNIYFFGSCTGVFWPCLFRRLVGAMTYSGVARTFRLSASISTD
jgi:hypothetical protein